MTCPDCRTEFSPDDLGSPRLIRNLLSSIRIKCIYTECGEIINYDDYEKHLNDCSEGHVKCTHCDEKVECNDFDKHQECGLI